MEASEHCLKYLQAELTNVCRRHPDLNKFVNFALSNKISDERWPDNVFIPTDGWAEYLGYCLPHEISNNEALDLYKTAIYGTWRYTQDVYFPDKKLLDQLKNTKITGNIPINIIFNLPSYSMFIDLSKEDMWGFFVQVDYSTFFNTVGLILFLVINYENFLPVWLPIRKNTTILDAVAEFVEFRKQYAKKHGFNTLVDEYERHLEIVHFFVSIILYLCSDKPDICNPLAPGTSPHRPEPKKVKGGMKLFPAQKPTIWEVGRNIGQALRNAASQSKEYQGGSHASPKAHIRRGHWHGYWTGPHSGNRKFVLKWLHPMLINLSMDAAE